jgi:hypothetical protein
VQSFQNFEFEQLILKNLAKPDPAGFPGFVLQSIPTTCYSFVLVALWLKMATDNFFPRGMPPQTRFCLEKMSPFPFPIVPH